MPLQIRENINQIVKPGKIAQSGKCSNQAQGTHVKNRSIKHGVMEPIDQSAQPTWSTQGHWEAFYVREKVYVGGREWRRRRKGQKKATQKAVSEVTWGWVLATICCLDMHISYCACTSAHTNTHEQMLNSWWKM